MDLRNCARLVAVFGLMPLFAACGGGGDESPAPPGPDPGSGSPAPSVQVTIFTNPTPGPYTSLGSSSTDEFSGVDPDSRLTNVSLESPVQPLLRYTASGNYEIQMPGATFDRLVPYSGGGSSTAITNVFKLSNTPQDMAIFAIELSRLGGYRHSELSNWSDSTAISRTGSLAFGRPTPSAAIPASGSATYRGNVTGTIDVAYDDTLAGESFYCYTPGEITLTVNFAARTITGTLGISVNYGPIMYTVPLSATTFQSATDTWWGSFETSESGFNELMVRLTGPDANELIGSWAAPILIDGEPHQMMGAWIAKRD